MPPAAATRKSGAPFLGVKRITSPFQLPGAERVASQSVRAGPPDASIALSLPPATNARERPSGDQNGPEAPSVPDRLRCLAIERTHPQQHTSSRVWRDKRQAPAVR